MPALGELLRRAASSGSHPDVAGVAVAIHIRRGESIGDPFSIWRDLRFGEAMHFDHVVESDGMLCRVLGGDCESERENHRANQTVSQKNTFHALSLTKLQGASAEGFAELRMMSRFRRESKSAASRPEPIEER